MRFWKNEKSIRKKKSRQSWIIIVMKEWKTQQINMFLYQNDVQIKKNSRKQKKNSDKKNSETIKETEKLILSFNQVILWIMMK